VENYRGQKCFSRLKYYLVEEYRAAFGERRLSEIGYLDLETYRNRRKETPHQGRKTSDGGYNKPGAFHLEAYAQ